MNMLAIFIEGCIVKLLAVPSQRLENENESGDSSQSVYAPFSVALCSYISGFAILTVLDKTKVLPKQKLEISFH